MNTYLYALGNPVMFIDPLGLIVWPFTDKHRNRNQHNQCPEKPPSPDSCNVGDSNGEPWLPDDPRAASIFHGGNDGYRRSDSSNGGSQCFYDPASEEPVREGGMQGTYDYSSPDQAGKWDHFWDDVFPHLIDQAYSTPDLTHWY